MIRLLELVVVILTLAGALAWSQTIPQAPEPKAMACAYNTVVPTPVNGKFFLVQCNSSGEILVGN